MNEKRRSSRSVQGGHPDVVTKRAESEGSPDSLLSAWLPQCEAVSSGSDPVSPEDPKVQSWLTEAGGGKCWATEHGPLYSFEGVRERGDARWG